MLIGMLGIYCSLFVSVCVCLSADFCNGYLRLRLMQGDEIWQNGRPGWLAGRLPFWWTLAQGLASQGQKVKNFSNAHLVDRLRDRAEILQDGREVPTAGLRQVRWTLTEGLAPSEAKIEKSTMHWTVVNQVWQIGWRVASQVSQTGQWRELWRSACGDICQFGQLVLSSIVCIVDDLKDVIDWMHVNLMVRCWGWQ